MPLLKNQDYSFVAIDPNEDNKVKAIANKVEQVDHYYYTHISDIYFNYPDYPDLPPFYRKVEGRYYNSFVVPYEFNTNVNDFLTPEEVEQLTNDNEIADNIVPVAGMDELLEEIEMLNNKIADNTESIDNNIQSIKTNKEDIEINAGNIQKNTDAISEIEIPEVPIEQIDKNTTDIELNKENIATNEGNIQKNTDAINEIEIPIEQIDKNTTDIALNKENISTNIKDIEELIELIEKVGESFYFPADSIPDFSIDTEGSKYPVGFTLTTTNQENFWKSLPGVVVNFNFLPDQRTFAQLFFGQKNNHEGSTTAIRHWHYFYGWTEFNVMTDQEIEWPWPNPIPEP